MAQLIVTQSHDYRGETLTDIDEIVFSGSDLTAIFGSNQFGGTGISNTVTLTLAPNSSFKQTVRVVLSEPGAFSAAGWSFNGFAGNIELIGTSGADTITGSSGFGSAPLPPLDKIAGGGGADTLNGGNFRTVFAYLASGDVGAGEIVNGGVGSDSLSIGGTTESVILDFTQVTLNGIEQLNFVTLAQRSATTMFTGAQLASMSGVSAGSGSDRIIVGGSSVDLSGLSFVGWNFQMPEPGFFAPDTIEINGTAGADSLTGSSESDIFTPGAGADTVSGGDGSDIFRILAPGDLVAGESLSGGAPGESASDELQISGGGSFDFSHVTLSAMEAVRFVTGGQTAIFNGTQIGGAGILSIMGSAGADALVVNGAAVDLSNLSFPTTSTGGPDAVTINGTPGADTLTGHLGPDRIAGGAGNDILKGGPVGGDDDTYVYAPGGDADTVVGFIAGASTADRIDAMAFGNLRTLADILAITTQNGADAIIDFGGGDTLTLKNVQKADLSADDFVFGQFRQPAFKLAAFAPDAGGWSSDNTYPRELADVTGDGAADIVGFGESGVYVAIATGGSFAAPAFKLAAFGPNAGGWTSEDRYPRELADVNGDGMADIVAFGEGGVYVALASSGGAFASPSFTLAAFAPGAGGWTSDDTYPRRLADVNGDNMTDIVAFGEGGAYVSLATGGGSFAAPSFSLAAFGASAGGWNSNDRYPRELADLNGDNMDDIVAFGEGGVYVALATGGGNFAAPSFTLAGFAPSAGGWIDNDRYPRRVADVNDDGFADLVGFGEDGVYLALSNGDGTFQRITPDLTAYAPAAGGWSSDDTYPRALADVSGDGDADIVGFGQGGVYVSLSNGLLLI